MSTRFLPLLLAFLGSVVAGFGGPAGEPPRLPGIGEAMRGMIAQGEVAGAVTVVVGRDGLRHLECTGLADVASGRPMTPDTLFDLMSMTKPVTAVAMLMLQDEGRLRVTDPVARFLPEFERLRTPSGQPANLTLLQVMTHTSGLGEAGGVAARQARTLAELVPLWLAAPMQFEPGKRWKYTQSGLNCAARIVEVVSGMTFPEFLARRLFGPLGMADTTHTPDAGQRRRIATPYARQPATGRLEPGPVAPPAPGERAPTGHAGLYATATDYARFCRMLLNGGSLDGRRYLSAEGMRWLTTPQTGDLPTLVRNDEFGQHGAQYAWGFGTCVMRGPHPGVAAMFSPGTFGHGGAWGTQAWIDPVKGVAYVLMIQRTNFPNGDLSPVRLRFQQAAAAALR